MPGNVTQEKPGVRPGRGSPEARDLLAAEYALGTLRGPALHRFERLLAVDEDLRRRVRHWENRLAPLAEEVAPQSPPASVWAGIEDRIGGSAFDGAGDGREKNRWWNSLALWRGVAAAATVALALVATWAFTGGSGELAPERMAVVTDAESKPLWVVSSGAPAGTIRVRTLGSPEMGPDRVCPLWLQWGNGDRTRRVAVLPEEKGTYTYRVPRDMPLERARLAVSVEPAGAVPEEGPTGEVIFQGDWIRL
ncbi:anti-sigma factor [Thiohalorhabdus sp.]|uniref:anti-sigma factor n=1 Tax=Thiohalorhabdus sp. TaxID=3094134 RepID=UPI002FC2F45F